MDIHKDSSGNLCKFNPKDTFYRLFRIALVLHYNLLHSKNKPTLSLTLQQNQKLLDHLRKVNAITPQIGNLAEVQI